MKGGISKVTCTIKNPGLFGGYVWKEFYNPIMNFSLNSIVGIGQGFCSLLLNRGFKLEVAVTSN